MSRQKRLLAVLAGLFVLALAYAFWATPRQQRVATTGEPPPPRRPAAESRVAAPAEGTRVRLDLLDRDPERFPGYRRDIFNYPRVAPPPPPRIARPPVPPPPPVEVPQPEAVPLEVERELARFTYLGFLEKDNVKTVFLSSEGEIFLVKRGERFGKGNQFQVAELTPDRLTIRHREDPRIITVPLVEQAPLVPSAPPRTFRPFPAPGTRATNGPVYDFVQPEEDLPDVEDDFSPPPAEEENDISPDEENGEPPPEGEGGNMEDNSLPPGGAADE